MYCSHCKKELPIAAKVETPEVPLTPEELADALILRKALKTDPDGVAFNFYPTTNYSCKKRGYAYTCVHCARIRAAQSIIDNRARREQQKAATKEAALAEVAKSHAEPPISWDPPRQA